MTKEALPREGQAPEDSDFNIVVLKRSELDQEPKVDRPNSIEGATLNFLKDMSSFQNILGFRFERQDSRLFVSTYYRDFFELALEDYQKEHALKRSFAQELERLNNTEIFFPWVTQIKDSTFEEVIKQNMLGEKRLTEKDREEVAEEIEKTGKYPDGWSDFDYIYWLGRENIDHEEAVYIKFE